MIDCPDITMRESLPEFLHGTLDGDAAERVQEHLDGCVDCSAELAILRSVLATAPAVHIDIASIVAALPSPVVAGNLVTVAESDPSVVSMDSVRRRSSWGTNRVLRLAAAVLLGAIGVVGVKAGREGFRSGGAPQIVTHTASSGVALVGVSGLNDAHLEQLIGEIDSFDAMPAAEPDVEPVVPVVLDGGA